MNYRKMTASLLGAAVLAVGVGLPPLAVATTDEDVCVPVAGQPFIPPTYATETEYTRQVEVSPERTETTDWVRTRPEGDGWEKIDTRTVVDQEYVPSVPEESHTDYLYWNVLQGEQWFHDDAGSIRFVEGTTLPWHRLNETQKHVTQEYVPEVPEVSHEEFRFERTIPAKYETETKWATENPGEGWTTTGNTRQGPMTDPGQPAIDEVKCPPVVDPGPTPDPEPQPTVTVTPPPVQEEPDPPVVTPSLPPVFAEPAPTVTVTPEPIPEPTRASNPLVPNLERTWTPPAPMPIPTPLELPDPEPSPEETAAKTKNQTNDVEGDAIPETKAEAQALARTGYGAAGWVFGLAALASAVTIAGLWMKDRRRQH